MSTLESGRFHSACVVRAVLQGFDAIIFPTACAHCGMAAAGAAICTPCRIAFLKSSSLPACKCCAASAGPYVDTSNGCFECRNEQFAFERAVRLGPYDDELAAACGRIKRLNRSRLAAALADLLVEMRRGELAALGCDIVVPAPLHWRRRVHRGYDQAAHLAQRIARQLQLPMANPLRRVRATADQKTLSQTARKANLRHAFVCRRPRTIAGKTVLLVDDVVTTGSTCHDAARALRAAGARVVHIAMIART